jgi:hypothetical protein
VGVLVIRVLVFPVFCIVPFMYIICSVCTAVRTAASGWKLNCSSSSSSSSSNKMILSQPPAEYEVGIRTKETGFKRIFSRRMKQLHATGASIFEM